MLIAHDIFICKPGNASKLAKLFKEVMANDKHVMHIMTDLVGQFNKVVMVSQYEDLVEYKKSWDEMMADTPENRAMGEKMKNYTDMYLTGSRELYRVA